MKVTNALVKHLVDKLGLDKKHLDASTRVEDEVRKAATDALVSGKMTPAELNELTSVAEVSEMQKMVSESVAAAMAPIADSMKSFSETIAKAFQGGSVGTAVVNPPATVTEGTPESGTKAMGTAGVVLGAAEGEAIRVKGAHERYSTVRGDLTYKSSGNIRNRSLFGDAPVVGHDGAVMQSQSQLDKAIAKTWWKHMVLRAANFHRESVRGGYTEHDKSMLHYIVDNCAFTGPVGARDEEKDEGAIAFLEGQKATDDRVKKSLLDNSASGGLEAVPIEFDNATIMTALLNGELFPLVTWRPTNRRRIEAYAMGEFTFTKVAEGTAITLFDTSAFITAFDTNIYPITGSVKLGLDFLEDAPNDVGAEVDQRWGDGFLKQMDNLVATGTGTDEITGVFTSAGTSAPSAATANLPYAISDAEALLFGVAKPYRSEAGARAVYLSNETVYQRFRAVPVGTTDERRVFGMTHEDYMLMGHSYRINETIPNTKAGFFAMNRFRGYRRRGFSVRIERGGQSLALSNEQLVVCRARMGGQLELGAAGSVIDDLPTS